MSTPQTPRSKDLSLRALGTARATITGTPLSAKGVERLNAFWRARDYLALGIYLPPDTSCLLSVANHCLRTESYVIVIVSDKQLHLQYLDIDAAIAHCTKGIGVWGGQAMTWARSRAWLWPVPAIFRTLEALVATALLCSEFPDLKLRFVNVVDVQIACRGHAHEHGIDAAEIADCQWPS